MTTKGPHTLAEAVRRIKYRVENQQALWRDAEIADTLEQAATRLDEFSRLDNEWEKHKINAVLQTRITTLRFAAQCCHSKPDASFLRDLAHSWETRQDDRNA